MISPESKRRALRTALWRSAALLGLTIALVAAVDRGARILGPALIVVGIYGGGKALSDWWRHLDAEWFAAEIVLVTLGWSLFAGAFAALQYVAFGLAPGAFYVDPDYARLVAPRYSAVWKRDSLRTAAELAGLDRAATALAADEPASFFLDSLYRLRSSTTVQLTERCEEEMPAEKCRWQLVVTAPGAPPAEIPVSAPESDRRSLSAEELRRELAGEQARKRTELAELERRLADPAGFVQPRIVDSLYDTGVAFSGNDAGVFVPISPLARFCKVLEFLASLLLFGIVVSRVSEAAGRRKG